MKGHVLKKQIVPSTVTVSQQKPTPPGDHQLNATSLLVPLLFSHLYLTSEKPGVDANKSKSYLKMDHAEEKQTKIKLLFTVKTINKNYTNFPSWFELSNLAFYQYFVFLS